MNKYQAPRGTKDVLPTDIKKWYKIEELIKQFTYVYNYQEIRTPLFEHTEVFKRGNDSSDMVNKEMYTFVPENSTTSITLRPECTAGVARSFVENKMYGYAEMPVKLYYVGPQFRHESPQKGRLRMFNQFGIECLGSKNPLLDVETIALGYNFINALGLKDLKVLINTLGSDEDRNKYRYILKEYFKNDISNMCDDCKRRYEQNPLRILDCKIDSHKDIMKNIPKMSNCLSDDSKEYFDMVLKGLDQLNIPYEIDERLVRGLDYYSHTVFEVVSINEDMGSQSTVFAGGRYDNLVEYFNGPSTSGIGWAMGIERLLLACEVEGIDLNEEDEIDAYILCLSDSAQLYVTSILDTLRLNGYRCERDYMSRKFKGQFKSVERLNAKVAIIVGEQDLENNTVSIKRIEDQQQFVVKYDELVDKMDELFETHEEHSHECNCGDDCKCHDK